MTTAAKDGSPKAPKRNGASSIADEAIERARSLVTVAPTEVRMTEVEKGELQATEKRLIEAKAQLGVLVYEFDAKKQALENEITREAQGFNARISQIAKAGALECERIDYDIHKGFIRKS